MKIRLVIMKKCYQVGTAEKFHRKIPAEFHRTVEHNKRMVFAVINHLTVHFQGQCATVLSIFLLIFSSGVNPYQASVPFLGPRQTV